MAVYTPLTAAQIDSFLAHYDIGVRIAHDGIISGVENTNYKITTSHGNYILTLFEKRVAAEDLPFFLAFMSALYDAGIPTAPVITDRAGHTHTTLAGKPALVTGFLKGSSATQITPTHTAAVGDLLGRMHQVGMGLSLTRANSMGPAEWRRLIAAVGASAASLYPQLDVLLARALDEIDHIWHRAEKQALPQGVVHADLFPDNVFFDGPAISGVIDFYFSCTAWLLYDLMLTMNAWCFDAEGQCDDALAQALVTAYQRQRPISPAETALAPAMGMAAALRIVATRLYDALHPVAGATVTPKDPMAHWRIFEYHRAQHQTGVAFSWWGAP